MGRVVTPRTPEQDDRLAAVTRAAQDRAEADAAYRRAILEAEAVGATLTAIGQAAGVTTESARRIVLRHKNAQGEA